MNLAINSGRIQGQYATAAGPAPGVVVDTNGDVAVQVTLVAPAFANFSYTANAGVATQPNTNPSGAATTITMSLVAEKLPPEVNANVALVYALQSPSIPAGASMVDVNAFQTWKNNLYNPNGGYGGGGYGGGGGGYGGGGYGGGGGGYGG